MSQTQRQSQTDDFFPTKSAAKYADLSENQIRNIVRRGLLTPIRGEKNTYKFSFQDVVILRRIKYLHSTGISMKKVLDHMIALKEQSGPERALSAINLRAVGGDVAVEEERSMWHVKTGQLLLNFEADPETRSAEIQEFPKPSTNDAQRKPEFENLDSDDWFNIGIELEESDVEKACYAYRRAIRLDEYNADAYVNLGRLLQIDLKFEDAKLLYEKVLDFSPDYELASFNLGTLYDDLQEYDKAIEHYRRAPTMELAHHNLARIFEMRGDEVSARRHLIRSKELRTFD